LYQTVLLTPQKKGIGPWQEEAARSKRAAPGGWCGATVTAASTKAERAGAAWGGERHRKGLHWAVDARGAAFFEIDDQFVPGHLVGICRLAFHPFRMRWM